MDPAKGDIWAYGLANGQKIYYLLLKCEPITNMDGVYGWETLLLALNNEAYRDDENRMAYTWYEGNIFWEKVA